MQIIVNLGRGKTLCLNFSQACVSVSDLKQAVAEREGIPPLEQRVVLSSRDLDNKHLFHATEANFLPPVQILFRLIGGKGGFGALLRGGAGRRRTQNQDACRDLSGRRLRDVENEKKLAEWYKEEKERELERMAEKYAKKKAYEEATRFDEESYHEQLAQINSSVKSSVAEGLLMHTKLKSIVEKQETKKKELLEKLTQDEELEVEALQPDEEFDGCFIDSLLHKRKRASSPPSQRVTPDGHLLSQAPATCTGEQEATSENSNTSLASNTNTPAENIAIVDVESIGSLEELQSISMDLLKQELQRRGMLCGGTAKQRAERLWSVRGISFDQIDSSVKPGGKKKSRKRKRTS